MEKNKEVRIVDIKAMKKKYRNARLNSMTQRERKAILNGKHIKVVEAFESSIAELRKRGLLAVSANENLESSMQYLKEIQKKSKAAADKAKKDVTQKIVVESSFAALHGWTAENNIKFSFSKQDLKDVREIGEEAKNSELASAVWELQHSAAILRTSHDFQKALDCGYKAMEVSMKLEKQYKQFSKMF